jgi:hypothetical protein
VIYLCAFMALPRKSAGDLSQHAMMAAGMAPSSFWAVGAMRINPASEDAAYRVRLKEDFFGNVPVREAAHFARRA